MQRVTTMVTDSVFQGTTDHYVGLSTDTKPTSASLGATCYEFNTGYTFTWNGYAWIPTSYMPGTTVNYKQVDIATEGAKDVMTATTQNLFIDAVVLHVPDDLTAVEAFTSLALATDDNPVIALMSATVGAKANISGNFYHVFRGPRVTVETKKIVLTVAGTPGAGKVANVTTLWRPVVAGGYYLNA